MTQPGSTPLKNGMHERFAQTLAADSGLSQVEAYCRAARPSVPVTKGRQVSASRTAARDDVRDRLSFLKRERADARQQASEPVTRESIHALLEEVTSALMDASRAASAAGADGIAQQLHKVIVVHAGRQNRAATRAPEEAKDRTSYDPAPALARLEWCSCDA